MGVVVGAFSNRLALAFALAFTLARAAAARLRDIERHPRTLHRARILHPASRGGNARLNNGHGFFLDNGRSKYHAESSGIRHRLPGPNRF